MNRSDESITGSSVATGPKGVDSPSLAAPVDASKPAVCRPGTDTETAEISARDWDMLDRMVQESLSKLTARLLAQAPGLVWKAGRTASRAFSLFSYRVFYHLDGDDYDPVVVGMTFSVRDAKVRVSGDISGDESGFVYFDEGCTLDSRPEPLAVRDAGRTVADRLASQHSIVIDAIRNRHPRAVPR